jgi:hypothetical protein
MERNNLRNPQRHAIIRFSWSTPNVNSPPPKSNNDKALELFEGDRIHLSELGRSRHPRDIKKKGTIVGSTRYPSSLRILWDGSRSRGQRPFSKERLSGGWYEVLGDAGQLISFRHKTLSVCFYSRKDRDYAFTAPHEHPLMPHNGSALIVVMTRGRPPPSVKWWLSFVTVAFHIELEL